MTNKKPLLKFRFLVTLAAEARAEKLASAKRLVRATFAEGRRLGLAARWVADRLVERTATERRLLAAA